MRSRSRILVLLLCAAAPGAARAGLMVQSADRSVTSYVCPIPGWTSSGPGFDSTTLGSAFSSLVTTTGTDLFSAGSASVDASQDTTIPAPSGAGMSGEGDVNLYLTGALGCGYAISSFDVHFGVDAAASYALSWDLFAGAGAIGTLSQGEGATRSVLALEDVTNGTVVHGICALSFFTTQALDCAPYGQAGASAAGSLEVALAPGVEYRLWVETNTQIGGSDAVIGLGSFAFALVPVPEPATVALVAAALAALGLARRRASAAHVRD